MKNIAIAVVGIVLGLWALPSLAADAASEPIVVAQTGVANSAMTDGEVKKVDKDAGKLTIKHGPLTNLDMPGMTMVFRVKDPAMLDQVKEGDKIRFVADRVDGAITVVELKPVK
jgi:Cu(I)/Ag(I) efflux system periplasmic protein CusF